MFGSVRIDKINKLPNPSATRAGVSVYLVHDGSRRLRKQPTRLAVGHELATGDHDGPNFVLLHKLVKARSRNSHRPAKQIDSPS